MELQHPALQKPKPMLQCLPAEMLITIIEECTWTSRNYQVGSPKTLRQPHAALARTCRRLHMLLNPLLYEWHFEREITSKRYFPRRQLDDPWSLLYKKYYSCFLRAAKNGRFDTLQLASRYGSGRVADPSMVAHSTTIDSWFLDPSWLKDFPVGLRSVWQHNQHHVPQYPVNYATSTTVAMVGNRLPKFLEVRGAHHSIPEVLHGALGNPAFKSSLPGQYGFSALQFTADSASGESVQCLLFRPDVAVSVKPHRGETVLHSVARDGNKNSTGLILRQTGINIANPDYTRRLALRVAVAGDDELYFEVIHCLIQLAIKVGVHMNQIDNYACRLLLHAVRLQSRHSVEFT